MIGDCLKPNWGIDEILACNPTFLDYLSGLGVPMSVEDCTVHHSCCMSGLRSRLTIDGKRGYYSQDYIGGKFLNEARFSGILPNVGYVKLEAEINPNTKEHSRLDKYPIPFEIATNLSHVLPKE
jgi:hypothetical protein